MTNTTEFITTVSGKITSIKRLQNDKDGNPRYDVHIVGRGTDADFRTSVGAQIAHEIENTEYKKKSHRFILSPMGYITGVQ